MQKMLSRCGGGRGGPQARWLTECASRQQPQPRRLPVPSPPSWPCPAARACGLPAADRAGPPRVWGASGPPWPGLRQAGSVGRAGRPQARAPAGAGWQGVGGRGQVGLREKWLCFSYTRARPSIPHRPPPHCAHGSSVPPRAPRLPRQSAPEPGGARRCMALAGAGQAPQDGGGECAGRPWSEGSSGSWPHGWPDGRVRIRRSVGGCCRPGVPWGKDCLLPERLCSQW